MALAIFAGSFFLNSFKPPVFENNQTDISLIANSVAPLETKSGLQSPVESPRLTQGFKFYHPGVDLAKSIGTPIKPMMGGIIGNIQHSRHGYGNAIIINHGNGTETLYAHLSKIYVEVGQQVNLNTIIGEVGTTGHSSGPHLHFEVRVDNKPINPTSILPSR